MSAAAEVPWQQRGSCNDVDPEAMFPEPTDLIGVEAAKRVCAGCDVRLDCLGWVLEHPQPHGVWAGLDENERKAMIRRRQRAAKRAREQPTAA